LQARQPKLLAAGSFRWNTFRATCPSSGKGFWSAADQASPDSQVADRHADIGALPSLLLELYQKKDRLSVTSRLQHDTHSRVEALAQ
jgi:hypothetical protein